MKKFKNKNGGFIGVLSLLIALAIIAFIFWRSDLFGGKGGQSQVETYKQDVDSAQAAKDLIEKRNEDTMKQGY